MSETSTPVTELLEQAATGDPEALAALNESIYPALRSIARRQLRAHQRGTLCTTDLVHETYLRLFGSDGYQNLEGSGHLYAAAARAMRHVLVDYARRQGAEKRGGSLRRVALEEGKIAAEHLPEQVLSLDGALEHLKSADRRCHEVVLLKFFAGCSIEDIAAHLEVSDMTVKRDWRKARAYLYASMAPEA